MLYNIIFGVATHKPGGDKIIQPVITLKEVITYKCGLATYRTLNSTYVAF